MIFQDTALGGACIVDPEPVRDERGEFARVFCRTEFERRGLDPTIAQCNLSYNRGKDTLRGMHYQVAPHEEIKVVTCISGAIYDVIIDLCADSPTFCRWIGVHLTARNRRMLYVPRGFAHGFQTMEDDTTVLYRVSEFYTPGAERGVRWNDPAFGIDWPPANRRIISSKDRQHPDFMAERIPLPGSHVL